MPPEIDEVKCNRCGTCALVCPSDVFYGSHDKEIPAVSYPDECWYCNACVLDCPQDAVRLRIPLPMRYLWEE